MAGQHNRKLEEGCGPLVEHLNVYRVDFLQLLDQYSMVVRVQYLQESKDKIAMEGKGDISQLKGGECTPKLVDARLFQCVGETCDDFHSLHSLPSWMGVWGPSEQRELLQEQPEQKRQP